MSVNHNVYFGFGVLFDRGDLIAMFDDYDLYDFMDDVVGFDLIDLDPMCAQHGYLFACRDSIQKIGPYDDTVVICTSTADPPDFDLSSLPPNTPTSLLDALESRDRRWYLAGVAA